MSARLRSSPVRFKPWRSLPRKLRVVPRTSRTRSTVHVASSPRAAGTTMPALRTSATRARWTRGRVPAIGAIPCLTAPDRRARPSIAPPRRSRSRAGRRSRPHRRVRRQLVGCSGSRRRARAPHPAGDPARARHAAPKSPPRGPAGPPSGPATAGRLRVDAEPGDDPGARDAPEHLGRDLDLRRAAPPAQDDPRQRQEPRVDVDREIRRQGEDGDAAERHAGERLPLLRRRERESGDGHVPLAGTVHVEPRGRADDTRAELLRRRLRGDDDRVGRVVQRDRVALAERRGVSVGGVDRDQLPGQTEALQGFDDPPLDPAGVAHDWSAYRRRPAVLPGCHRPSRHTCNRSGTGGGGESGATALDLARTPEGRGARRRWLKKPDTLSATWPGGARLSWPLAWRSAFEPTRVVRRRAGRYSRQDGDGARSAESSRTGGRGRQHGA